MDPIWSLEATGLHQNRRPCRGCGITGKHLSIEDYRCAVSEKETATAARVLAENAYHGQHGLGQFHQQLTYYEGVDLCQHEKHIASLKEALKHAEEMFADAKIAHAKQKKFDDGLRRHRCATMDILRATEIEEQKAKDVMNAVLAKTFQLPPGDYTLKAEDEEDQWWENTGYSNDVHKLFDFHEHLYDRWVGGFLHRHEDPGNCPDFLKEARKLEKAAEMASPEQTSSKPMLQLWQRRQVGRDDPQFVLVARLDPMEESVPEPQRRKQPALPAPVAADLPQSRSGSLTMISDSTATAGRPQRTERRMRRSQPY